MEFCVIYFERIDVVVTLLLDKCIHYELVFLVG